jgi:dihydrofolate reductase
MRRVIFSMAMPLDGYVAPPDGSPDWAEPDAEVFRFVTDELREVGAYLLGRRLYEVMSYWETVDQNPSLDYSTREFAALWRALPKVVFSTTPPELRGNTRRAEGDVAQEIARLRAVPGGDIAIGGPTLAAQAAAHGLIDEYRIRLHPVTLGGGIPFFASHGRGHLEPVETRAFDSGVVFLRYRVAHRTP